MKKIITVIFALSVIMCMGINALSVSAADSKNLSLKATATQDPNGENRKAENGPQTVVDGDKKTRWAGNAGVDENNDFKIAKATWVCLEFPSEAEIDKVVIDWFESRADEKGYKIQVSDTGEPDKASAWKNVASQKVSRAAEKKVDDQAHCVDTVTFTLTKCKYVRVLIEKGISKDGPSIWEFETYNTKNPDFSFDAASSVTSKAAESTAASTENASKTDIPDTGVDGAMVWVVLATAAVGCFALTLLAKKATK